MSANLDVLSSSCSCHRHDTVGTLSIKQGRPVDPGLDLARTRDHSLTYIGLHATPTARTASTMSGALRRSIPGASPGLGSFGGAFLLINALSGKVYELLAESTNTIVRGYELHGGVIGLVKSTEFRALLRRYLYLVSIAFAFERLRKLWSFVNIFASVTKCKFLTRSVRATTSCLQGAFQTCTLTPRSNQAT